MVFLLSFSWDLFSFSACISYHVLLRENKDDELNLGTEPAIVWPFLRAKIFPWVSFPILKVYG